MSRSRKRLQKVLRDWSRHGWRQAADYHVWCYDYPFDENDPEGLRRSASRMEMYAAEVPDRKRWKAYRGRPVVRLPSPRAVVLPMDARSVWEPPARQGHIDRQRLGAALGMTFGIVGTIRPQWRGRRLLLRSSPSGGARHPTEAYLLVLDVKGWGAGWYHVQIAPSQLVFLGSDRSDRRSLARYFPRMSSAAPFTTKAVVVLTSVFARNMYRYRAPRTFRSVHMDAGHLCETFESVCAAVGLKTFVQYASEDAAIEKQLQLDPLQEGIQLSIGVG